MSASGVTVDEITDSIEEKKYLINLDLNNRNFIETLCETNTTKLDEIVKLLLVNSNIYGNEKALSDKPKYQYSDNNCDAFDFYSRFGCVNCGTDYVFDQDILHQQFLVCKNCNYCAAPIHKDNESDDVQLNNKFLKNESNGIYVKGTRKYYSFDINAKAWWHKNLLPAALQKYLFDTSQNIIDSEKFKEGQIINEICAKCGNDKAYYTQFQARSADEGSTILYECTKCHTRKTFNN